MTPFFIVSVVDGVASEGYTTSAKSRVFGQVVVGVGVGSTNGRVGNKKSFQRKI